jgi:peptidoglycan/LPS O-acetylase OafA/YrhL
LQSPALAAPARPPLRALTGLRFVAALQVLVFHCVPWASWRMPPPVRSVAGSGYVAVSLFFVLSGFILSYVHDAPGARAMDRNHFYLARFARVYPVYAFALALVAPFFFVHTIRTEGVAALVAESAPVASLLQAWLPSAAMAWNPPAWSLSAEAFFYALFPLVAPPLMAARRETALAVGIGCYAVSLLVPLVYIHLAPDGPIPLSHETMAFWLNVVRYNPAVRFPEFVLGIVLARFYPVGARLAMLAPTASVIFVGGAVAILSQAPALPYIVLHNGLLAPLFGLLILSLTVERGPVVALLSTRPMVALGNASYSLYLLHIPLLIYWSKLMAHLPERAGCSGARTTAFLCFAVACSLVCHRYVELSLRDSVLRRWAPPKRAVPFPTPEAGSQPVSAPANNSAPSFPTRSARDSSRSD